LYTQLISFESDEYASAVAKTLDEARNLIEAGFDYVTDMESVKLFRKRKWPDYRVKRKTSRNKVLSYIG